MRKTIRAGRGRSNDLGPGNAKLPKLYVAKSRISGLGLYAGEKIHWGRPIIEYAGQRISKRVGNKREKFYDKIGVNYLFDLNSKHDIDGLVGGNESRFINHAARKFNCVPIRFSERIWFFAYFDIAKDEELLFDYGYQP